MVNAATDRILAPTRELGWRDPAARGPAPATTPPRPNQDPMKVRSEAVTRPTSPTPEGSPRGLHERSREWSSSQSTESTTSLLTLVRHRRPKGAATDRPALPPWRQWSTLPPAPQLCKTTLTPSGPSGIASVVNVPPIPPRYL